MRNNNTFKITLVALCVAINIVGGFLALTLKLPIYLDTIGTFLAAFTFGPLAGILTGAASSLINGMTYDVYSLYFMPTQIIVGFAAGCFYKKGYFKGKKIVLGILSVTILGSIMSSIISAYVFGGITSSGSAFIVMYLKEAGIGIVKSVFSTQVFTDLIDKGIAVSLVISIINTMPFEIKKKYSIGEQ